MCELTMYNVLIGFNQLGSPFGRAGTACGRDLSARRRHASEQPPQAALSESQRGENALSAPPGHLSQRERQEPQRLLCVCCIKSTSNMYNCQLETYLRAGREAAATDWPTRRIFSSGRVTRHFFASSGYSSARTSLHTRRMVSPPLPDMTRPRSIMYSRS